MVESERLFGLQVDKFLILNAHIQKDTQHNCRETRSSVQDKTLLSISSKENVLQQLPHMDYCSTLWGNANPPEGIYTLQRRAATIGAREIQVVTVGIQSSEWVGSRQYMCVVQIGLEHFDQNNPVKCKRGLVCLKSTARHLQELCCCKWCTDMEWLRSNNKKLPLSLSLCVYEGLLYYTQCIIFINAVYLFCNFIIIIILLY